jgi:hypothetical protein
MAHAKVAADLPVLPPSDAVPRGTSLGGFGQAGPTGRVAGVGSPARLLASSARRRLPEPRDLPLPLFVSWCEVKRWERR